MSTTSSLEWSDMKILSKKTLTNESSSHSMLLLNGLNDLRCCEKLLDVTLIVEGKSFKAHRSVLAASSDYFRAMFTDGMKEANQNEIILKGVTAKGLELVIDYVYTSKLDLNRNNIQDILSAAAHIQMVEVVKACSNYLETQIDMDNCVDIATIADLYSLETLKQKTFGFISFQLSAFAQSGEINRFSCDQLVELLSCDYPVDCSETHLLTLVVHWIAKTKADLKDVKKLLSQVRFDEIVPYELEKFLTTTNGEYHSVILSLSQQRLSPPKNCPLYTYDNALTNSRGMELALINIGGFSVDGITNNISYYLPSRKKWHNLTIIPHVEQCNYGTAVLGNDLFIVGGCYDVCLKEYIHPFGFRYCPMKNDWTTISPMLNDRCRFTLNTLGKYLYAVGGVSEVNDNDDNWVELPESNCERYDTKRNTWEYISSLPENRTQHAGVVHRYSLYISGGLERHRALASFWSFNTFLEEWKELRPMPHPRVDHSMLLINEKIYVCGGWNEDPALETRQLNETIDVYDIQQKRWFLETVNPKPKFHSGIAAINNKIYFIGGLHSDPIFNRASSAIELYDLEAKCWSVVDPFPQNIWESTCITLYVPRCREDMEVISDAEETPDIYK